jgi:hypothetical protein
VAVGQDRGFAPSHPDRRGLHGGTSTPGGRGRDSPSREPRPIPEDLVKLLIERIATAVETAHLRWCRRCRP